MPLTSEALVATELRLGDIGADVDCRGLAVLAPEKLELRMVFGIPEVRTEFELKAALPPYKLLIRPALPSPALWIPSMPLPKKLELQFPPLPAPNGDKSAESSECIVFFPTPGASPPKLFGLRFTSLLHCRFPVEAELLPALLCKNAWNISGNTFT